MAAADQEPFSPSVFLDLPPTPGPDGNDGEDPEALPDNLVLPYISRMLMEEDMHEQFFYQFPDHPALLHAQEPYAQILSDAATDFSSAAASSSGSSNDTADGSGSTFTLSPSSSDIPVFADATWPYDPLELTQRLAVGDASAGCFPGGGEVNQISEASALFSGQNRVNMEMLNQAFLKGMEEASKFLPTNNSRRILKPRDNNGSGRKNRHRNWDGSLEGETGRNNKLMVPEPEETGETVDKMVFEGYLMCVDNMKSLRIAMGTESDKNKNTTSTKKGNGKPSAQRSRESTDGAVDLQTLLIHCAQAVSMDDHRSATELLRQIKQQSSPRGDANQRLALFRGGPGGTAVITLVLSS